MPTTRKRIRRGRRSFGSLELTEPARCLLWDLAPTWDQATRTDQPEHALDWEYFLLRCTDDMKPPTLGDYWEVYREQVLRDWIREHPGTRPSAWWRFESGLTNPAGSWCISPPEDERAWLAEHGLLAPGELKRLSGADFEPEGVQPNRGQISITSAVTRLPSTKTSR